MSSDNGSTPYFDWRGRVLIPTIKVKNIGQILLYIKNTVMLMVSQAVWRSANEAYECIRK